MAGLKAEAVTHLLVVAELERATRFYVDLLGAEPYREYGGTSAVLRLGGTWLLLVTAGGPTWTFDGQGRPQIAADNPTYPSGATGIDAESAIVLGPA
jgi:catechol 2,3-dioxygenase-like lactoylglutathione lyase family enzyme